MSDAELMDNQAYYDEFANWYERKRGYGYHQMLDDLEIGIVKEFGRGGSVLEVGCGTGLLLERIAGFAKACEGIDLSPEMLTHAEGRGLRVQVASATALPQKDQSFDVTCSFKVLAHVPDITKAMAEMARVTKVGGYVLAEFYNKRSLRYLIKKAKKPSKISYRTTDTAVYTRYDDEDDIARYLPDNLVVREVRGIRIVTPHAKVHDLPFLGGAMRALEGRLTKWQPVTKYGGFLVVIAQRVA